MDARHALCSPGSKSFRMDPCVSELNIWLSSESAQKFNSNFNGKLPIEHHMNSSRELCIALVAFLPLCFIAWQRETRPLSQGTLLGVITINFLLVTWSALSLFLLVMWPRDVAIDSFLTNPYFAVALMPFSVISTIAFTWEYIVQSRRAEKRKAASSELASTR